MLSGSLRGVSILFAVSVRRSFFNGAARRNANTASDTIEDGRAALPVEVSRVFPVELSRRFSRRVKRGRTEGEARRAHRS